MINIFLVLSIVLSVMVILLVFLALRQKKSLSKYDGIVDIEKEKRKLTSDVKSLTNKIKSLSKEKSEAENLLASLKSQVAPLESELDIQSYGLYQPVYDLGFSENLKDELDKVRQKQKAMIREKTAIVCHVDWHVEGSKAKGRTMINRQIQLMARAFNGECDSIIPKVRYNNYDSIVKRMTSAYNAINKLGETQSCRIDETYFNLKIDELLIVHKYQEQTQFEKEEQRRINEQIREEQRAQRELEKARQQSEKEEGQYQKALEKARQEVEKATGEKQEKLQSEIQRLNELLSEAQANKERALSRAQMTRSGYVYVISNIGSFGEEVYKIGMTRRLEPNDRVRELGDASVPFPFDVHAMIFSEDAPTLENDLHRQLEARSVNRINTRKEFFKVSLDEIEAIVKNHDVEANFIRIPNADQFRQTQAIITRESQQTTL